MSKVTLNHAAYLTVVTVLYVLSWYAWPTGRLSHCVANALGPSGRVYYVLSWYAWPTGRLSHCMYSQCAGPQWSCVLCPVLICLTHRQAVSLYSQCAGPQWSCVLCPDWQSQLPEKGLCNNYHSNYYYLTLYQQMTANDVMVFHKPIRIYMYMDLLY